MGCLCGKPKPVNENYVRPKANYKDLIATYELDEQPIGAGEFGVVLHGTNKNNSNQEVAIKQIDKSFLTNREINDIHKEVQILHKIDHANVVNYYETYDSFDEVYLCMEFCRGGDLLQQITEKKMQITEASAADIFQQLLSALNHIHHQGIIHRDIKPDNIMFDKPNGTVKFIDFGLACQLKYKIQNQAGTPLYMAPEIFNESYSKECDIWSLGVVLYQYMSGDLPFKGKTMAQLQYNIKNSQIKMPAHFSPNLKDLLSKMLQKDPKERLTIEQAKNHPWFKNKSIQQDVDEETMNEIIEKLKKFKRRSKLKQASLYLLVSQISQDKLNQKHSVFQKLDRNNDGMLSKSEVECVLDADSTTGRTAESNLILSQIDYAQNKQINYTEFLTATVDSSLLKEETRIEGVFNIFDVDNDGSINVQDMKNAFSKFGQSISQQEIDEVLTEHDINQDGQINFEEFKEMLIGK